ncbi:class I SAM-dependent methyltransferase [Paenibacillus radicis (ex Xue et al. 2023)]|uniref:Methyltransferase n=1 Tax=Paenibacillus radicis (ex Xue et al. 2023) TaxID=2972489 RepID=A0ABT1YEX3_9BACL|nr:methyltransferase [Paenibacillus radicis (ex Xue et al. 2023)]MCR8631749.1 methyltransferase [Paenibacillus radicis (ex Xue et al. 2023)]
MIFLYKFIRTPKTIGSVTPSSRFLAKKMIEAISWQDTCSVAELGAGTGVITEAINHAAVKGTRVLLFEKDSHLSEQLALQYPEYTTYSEARALSSSVQQLGLEHLDCVISGLPFANFPQRLRDEIMEQVVASLKPNGLFVAFQYSLQMKKQLSRHFDIQTIHFVLLNVPPAFVYVCKKKDPTKSIQP